MSLGFPTHYIEMIARPSGKNVVLKWQGKPLFVRHRTAEEIATSVNTPVSDLKDSVNIPLDGVRMPSQYGVCNDLFRSLDVVARVQ